MKKQGKHLKTRKTLENKKRKNQQLEESHGRITWKQLEGAMDGELESLISDYKGTIICDYL